jgi:hypothetical protein
MLWGSITLNKVFDFDSSKIQLHLSLDLTVGLTTRDNAPVQKKKKIAFLGYLATFNIEKKIA